MEYVTVVLPNTLHLLHVHAHVHHQVKIKTVHVCLVFRSRDFLVAFKPYIAYYIVISLRKINVRLQFSPSQVADVVITDVVKVQPSLPYCTLPVVHVA